MRIHTRRDPDEDVEGEPSAKGNLVVPSPIFLSEEEEEQEEGVADRHHPTLKRVTRERTGRGYKDGQHCAPS